MKEIQIIVLTNRQVLISQIEDVGSDLGEPDCRLTNPFLIKDSFLEPWNGDYTSQIQFMIHSDKILTILEPKPEIQEKYLALIKE